MNDRSVVLSVGQMAKRNQKNYRAPSDEYKYHKFESFHLKHATETETDFLALLFPSHFILASMESHKNIIIRDSLLRRLCFHLAVFMPPSFQDRSDLTLTHTRPHILMDIRRQSPR